MLDQGCDIYIKRNGHYVRAGTVWTKKRFDLVNRPDPAKSLAGYNVYNKKRRRCKARVKETKPHVRTTVNAKCWHVTIDYDKFDSETRRLIERDTTEGATSKYFATRDEVKNTLAAFGMVPDFTGELERQALGALYKKVAAG